MRRAQPFLPGLSQELLCCHFVMLLHVTGLRASNSNFPCLLPSLCNSCQCKVLPPLFGKLLPPALLEERSNASQFHINCGSNSSAPAQSLNSRLPSFSSALKCHMLNCFNGYLQQIITKISPKRGLLCVARFLK